MDYFAISFSILFIGLGLLVKRYPNLISGYNTMSAKKKVNVEIDKVSSLLCKGLIIGGVTAGVLYYVFKFLDMPEIAMLALIGLPLVIILVANVLAQKYDHNPKTTFEKILPIALCIVIPLFVIGMMAYNTQPTQIGLDNNKVVISGSYGLTINYSDIDTIEKLESLPHIKTRTNGASIGDKRKGHFRLDKYGRCLLFIDGFHPPFILITKKNGKKIIFNAPQGDTDELLKTYEVLQKALTN